MRKMKAMECECGSIMVYDYHYECYECECGMCYNALGQELAPKKQWQEEYDSEDVDY